MYNMAMSSLQIKLFKRRLNPELFLWKKRDYALPATNSIKRSVLVRHSQPNSDWLETGTYLGETAEFLAKKFLRSRVHSIEPSDQLYTYSRKRLSDLSNLTVHFGSSEAIMGQILAANPSISNFWLDGHHSGDITFRGSEICPIIFELETIQALRLSNQTISVFIDDFRLFGCEPGYPTKEFLVKWANDQTLDWGVEADIFYCKSKIN
jgi:hypothetical protein